MTMGAMVAGLRGKTGDAMDKAFLAEMIPHHQGAVDMANMTISSGKHPELRKFCQGVVTDQTKEIGQMRAMEAKWGYGGPMEMSEAAQRAGIDLAATPAPQRAAGRKKLAKAKGKTLKYGFYKDYRGGWFDNLGIPTTSAHPECALAYINYVLHPKIEAALATSLISGTTNAKSVGLVGKSDQIYDYTPVKRVVSPAENLVEFPDPTPPDSTASGIMNFQDWANAWQSITAGQ